MASDPNRRGPGDRNRQNNKPKSIFDECLPMALVMITIAGAVTTVGGKVLRRAWKKCGGAGGRGHGALLLP